jgi:hypothetical protein
VAGPAVAVEGWGFRAAPERSAGSAAAPPAEECSRSATEPARPATGRVASGAGPVAVAAAGSALAGPAARAGARLGAAGQATAAAARWAGATGPQRHRTHRGQVVGRTAEADRPAVTHPATVRPAVPDPAVPDPVSAVADPVAVDRAAPGPVADLVPGRVAGLVAGPVASPVASPVAGPAVARTGSLVAVPTPRTRAVQEEVPQWAARRSGRCPAQRRVRPAVQWPADPTHGTRRTRRRSRTAGCRRARRSGRVPDRWTAER